MREKIMLVCCECLSRNYVTTKIKGVAAKRFEVTKFCKKCGRHTIHRESR